MRSRKILTCLVRGNHHFRNTLFRRRRTVPYAGISFFNALYNPAFHKSSAERRKWLQTFQQYGINVLRVWCQWDNRRGFVDAGPESTMYEPDGTLRKTHLKTLKELLSDAKVTGTVIELVLFAKESRESQLTADASDKAVAGLTRELTPFRNLTFQIWNEFSERVLEHLKTIKSHDPKRLVTNSPGAAGVLGDDEQNRALDYLTPHTSRHDRHRHWEQAPREIARMLKKFEKPVVDDEPARNGTSKFGGPKEATSPYDHIVQIYSVWQLGAYITYHHDMFQTGYGTSAVPTSGIPEPEFSPYHKQVLEFVAQKERFAPTKHFGKE